MQRERRLVPRDPQCEAHGNDVATRNRELRARRVWHPEEVPPALAQPDPLEALSVLHRVLAQAETHV
jgi:hypothetical protein